MSVTGKRISLYFFQVVNTLGYGYWLVSEPFMADWSGKQLHQENNWYHGPVGPEHLLIWPPKPGSPGLGCQSFLQKQTRNLPMAEANLTEGRLHFDLAR